MAFNFSTRGQASTAATAGALAHCRERAALADADLAKARREYEQSSIRFASNVDSRRDSADARSAHSRYADAKGLNERAADAVTAAQQLHSDALAREAVDAETARWDDVDRSAKARTVAAQAITAAALQLAAARSECEQAATALWASIPNRKHGMEMFARMAEQIDGELRRTGASQEHGLPLAYPALQPLVDLVGGLDVMLADARKTALGAE